MGRVDHIVAVLRHEDRRHCENTGGHSLEKGCAASLCLRQVMNVNGTGKLFNCDVGCEPAKDQITGQHVGIQVGKSLEHDDRRGSAAVDHT